jgi:hypothetical protein
VATSRLGALENNPVLLPAGKIHGDFAVFQAVESPRWAVALEQRRDFSVFLGGTGTETSILGDWGKRCTRARLSAPPDHLWDAVETALGFDIESHRVEPAVRSSVKPPTQPMTTWSIELIVSSHHPSADEQVADAIARVASRYQELRLDTKPALTGSDAVVNTIGIVFVAAIAVRMATSLAPAQITVTLRLTRSAAMPR